MKRVFSGIQPSGKLTLGNYLGAIKQMIALQDEYDALYCVVDLHAITVEQDPKKLKRNSRELAALYVACGLDPKKCNLFIQSDVPYHAELGWVMQTTASMGELERMTQYKEKSNKHQNTVGLFTYPTLMAADILLYDTNLVPVGHDQKQHLEVTRDWAIRFNNKFGDTFVVPEVLIPTAGARVMDLQEPTNKMSKSAKSEKGTIYMLDDLDDVRNKIKKAVTDSEGIVKYDIENKPAVSNLISIYANITNQTIAEVENEFAGQNYGIFKGKLTEVIINELETIQANFNKIINSSELDEILEIGANNANKIAESKMKEVKTTLGLGR